jgi:hypothetical protein
MTTAQDGGKVVSLTYRPPFPQEIFLVLISVRGWVDPRAIVQPAGLCHWKIPMTPSGIEPATCRFVAYSFNHYATTRPHLSNSTKKYFLYLYCLFLSCSHIITVVYSTLGVWRCEPGTISKWTILYKSVTILILCRHSVHCHIHNISGSSSTPVFRQSVVIIQLSTVTFLFMMPMSTVGTTP